MEIKNEYLAGLMERVIKRNPNEPEFHQAVFEVLESLVGVAEAHPEYIERGVFELSNSEFRGLMITARFRLTEVTEFSLTVQSVLTRADFVFIRLFMKELSNSLALSRFSKTV